MSEPSRPTETPEPTQGADAQDDPTDSVHGSWRELLATAAQLGAYAWTERRLFEILGRWSVSETSPALKVLLNDQSRQHAWHAEVLFARLPELREVDAERLVVAPGAAFSTLMDEVADAGTTIERLVGLYRVVVPYLLVSYRHEVSAATDVTGTSLRRWFGFLISDLTEEMVQGEELLHRLVADSDGVDLAAEQRRRLEHALVRCAGATLR